MKKRLRKSGIRSRQSLKAGMTVQHSIPASSWTRLTRPSQQKRGSYLSRADMTPTTVMSSRPEDPSRQSTQPQNTRQGSSRRPISAKPLPKYVQVRAQFRMPARTSLVAQTDGTEPSLQAGSHAKPPRQKRLRPQSAVYNGPPKQPLLSE